jgi:ubiquitin C-terminal hydrolase
VPTENLYFRSSMAATNGIDVLISASSSASGCQNVGDRCYLNTILQCLSRTPLLMANFAVEHSTSGAALNCLRDLTKLTSMLSIQDNGNASKDLANLLTCIQDKYQQTGRHSPAVENIFSGVHNSRLTCLRCGCCSQLDGEQFYHLNIAVPAGNAASVPDAVAASVRASTAAELLTSEHRWECVACKMKAQVRQYTIYAVSYPEFYPYLLWTSSLQPMKQVGLVKLPPVLVLRLKCSDELGGNATTQIQLDPGLTFASTEGAKLEYSLYGVVVHVSAGSEQGHYIGYIKVKHEQLRHYILAHLIAPTLPQEKHGAWYQVDDNAVTPVQWELVRNRQAHLLFYSADISVPQSQQAASGKHRSAGKSDCVVGEAVGRWRVNTANTGGKD